MDADQFDRLSRNFAERVSRRSAVRNLGGVSILGVALGGLRLFRTDALAQSDTATCELDLVANVRMGPSVDTAIGGELRGELRGKLRFALGDNGRLVDGILRLADNSELNAVGQVAGPALTVRIELPLGDALVLVGAGQNALRSCAGAVDGLLIGPAPGDIGDWHTTATKIGGITGEAQPTQPSVPVATIPPSGNNPPPPTEQPPTEAATTEPTATTVACVQPGDPCGLGHGDCCAGLVCIGGCYIPIGSPCDNSSHCIGFTCEGGFCLAPPTMEPTSPKESCIPTLSACSPIGGIPCCEGTSCMFFPGDLTTGEPDKYMCT
jgi:hypothetical protein